MQKRLQALFDDNAVEIDFIVRQSEFSVKKGNPMKNVKAWSCIISGFDNWISWIQCDLCKLWFHMLCKGVVTSDVLRFLLFASNLDEMHHQHYEIIRQVLSYNFILSAMNVFF